MNVTFSLASYGLSGYEWYLMAGLSAILARLSLEAGGNDPAPERPAPAVHQALRGVPLPGFARLGTTR